MTTILTSKLSFQGKSQEARVHKDLHKAGHTNPHFPGRYILELATELLTLPLSLIVTQGPLHCRGMNDAQRDQGECGQKAFLGLPPTL